jgi:hypothetical protein
MPDLTPLHLYAFMTYLGTWQFRFTLLTEFNEKLNIKTRENISHPGGGGASVLVRRKDIHGQNTVVKPGKQSAFEGFLLLSYLVAVSRMRSWLLERTQSTAVGGERMVVSSRPVETPGATTRRIRVKFSILTF